MINKEDLMQELHEIFMESGQMHNEVGKIFDICLEGRERIDELENTEKITMKDSMELNEALSASIEQVRSFYKSYENTTSRIQDLYDAIAQNKPLPVREKLKATNQKQESEENDIIKKALDSSPEDHLNTNTKPSNENILVEQIEKTVKKDDFVYENIIVPEPLSVYKDVFIASTKDVIMIDASPEEDLNPTESKFFGTPYLPKDWDYPVDEHGRVMLFISQINFEEIPHLENFPQTGILQFYISFEDEMLGLDRGQLGGQRNYRVFYFENPEELTISQEEQMYKHKFTQCELMFRKKLQLPIAYSEDFERMMVPFTKQKILMSDEEQDLYNESFFIFNHQIGGYPGFTQEDPRLYKPMKGQSYKLLFQMNSDESQCESGFMWGDVGIANWFIKEEDLKKRDFSKVVFNWDCY